MSSEQSALESSASQLESVSAVSLSHASVTASKLKVASPRPKRWMKHSHHPTIPKQLEKEDWEGAQNLLEGIPEIREAFEILSKIGEGTFSSVFLASLRDCPEEKFALKHLVPTSSPSRIENELKCLQMMGGRDNVIPIHTCVRHKDNIVLIMPYFPHDRFADYLPLMTVSEAREYMRALFLALRNVHSHHMIHRDIKPSNFLYNRATKQFQLVDFGLAHLEPRRLADKEAGQSRPNPRRSASETASTSDKGQGVTNGLIPPNTYQRQVHQRMLARAGKQPSSSKGRNSIAKQNGYCDSVSGGKVGGSSSREEVRLCPLRHKVTDICDFCTSRSNQPAPRAGTPGFRAPEVLLKCPNQTTAVDTWSAGVILLCILSGRYPFFRAHDDLSALAQIICLLGSRECTRAARNYGKELVCTPEVAPTDLRELCRTLRTALSNQTPDSDLLPSPRKRPRLCNGETTPLRSGVIKSPRTRKSPRKRACNSPRTRPPHSSPNSLGSSPYRIELSEPEFDSWENIPESAYDLLYRCLDLNPATRVSAEGALQHPFLSDQR